MEKRVQLPVFRSKSRQKMQRFIVLPVAGELCRSRGVVSERPALPAGPSPQGTQVGNGSGPSNPIQLGEMRGSMNRKSTLVGPKENKSTHRCCGDSCRRGRGLGSKYAATFLLEHRRHARKSKGSSEGTSNIDNLRLSQSKRSTGSRKVTSGT